LFELEEKFMEFKKIDLKRKYWKIGDMFVINL